MTRERYGYADATLGDMIRRHSPSLPGTVPACFAHETMRTKVSGIGPLRPWTALCSRIRLCKCFSIKLPRSVCGSAEASYRGSTSDADDDPNPNAADADADAADVDLDEPAAEEEEEEDPPDPEAAAAALEAALEAKRLPPACRLLLEERVLGVAASAPLHDAAAPPRPWLRHFRQKNSSASTVSELDKLPPSSLPTRRRCPKVSSPSLSCEEESPSPPNSRSLALLDEVLRLERQCPAPSSTTRRATCPAHTT